MAERLFVAVEIPADARAAMDAAVAPLRSRFDGVRWTAPSDWHLTLVFLGETPDERVDAAEAALFEAAGAVGPFPVAFDGAAGRFGKRVLWAGIEPNPPLGMLATAAAAAVRAHGFEIEPRDFSAHLTLARSRRAAPIRAEMADAFAGPTPSWMVDGVVLMRSRRGGRGPRYEVRAEAPLRGRSARE